MTPYAAAKTVASDPNACGVASATMTKPVIATKNAMRVGSSSRSTLLVSHA